MIYFVEDILDFNEDVIVNNVYIGFFDGLHIGHQSLFSNSTNNDLIITFDNKNNTEKIFNTDIKIEQLKKYSDNIIVINFENNKAKTKDDFILFLNKLSFKKIIIGEDFKFGYKKSGNINDLCNKFSVDDVKFSDYKVSSSKIRTLLLEGDINSANKLLGYNFFVKGNVKHGKKLGRTIDFPTANIIYNSLLKHGVYETKTKIYDKIYTSITNVGTKPTLNDNEILIESYILDFDSDIYNKDITVFFVGYIRDIKKFNNLEELKVQLEKDKKYVIGRNNGN